MSFRIENRDVGPGHPCYVVAEMSANHDQDFARAEALVRKASDCGADAIKLQTFTADTITLDVNRPPFTLEHGLWKGQTLHELYQKAAMPWEWQPRLKALADSLGIHLFSSPFDPTAVDFLEAMDVGAFKVASFEITDIPLVQRIARTGKPVIISTGMASLGEIDEVVRAAREAGANAIALLRCNSAYPASDEDMNLASIPHLAATFGVPVGLSDHTRGVEAAVTAVALGACIIEKHFHLGDGTSLDSEFSLDPEQLAEMVRAIRKTERMIGHVRYGPSPSEVGNATFRRSLYACRDIAEGEAFTDANVRSVRPGGGLHPRHLREIVGLVARRPLKYGEPLTWSDVGSD